MIKIEPGHFAHLCGVSGAAKNQADQIKINGRTDGREGKEKRNEQQGITGGRKNTCIL